MSPRVHAKQWNAFIIRSCNVSSYTASKLVIKIIIFGLPCLGNSFTTLPRKRAIKYLELDRYFFVLQRNVFFFLSFLSFHCFYCFICVQMCTWGIRRRKDMDGPQHKFSQDHHPFDDKTCCRRDCALLFFERMATTVDKLFISHHISFSCFAGGTIK